MDILSSLVADAKDVIGKIEGEVSRTAGQPDTLVQAVARLETLHAQLGTVNPDDLESIGKIFVEVGTIVQSFFPQWSEEGAFLVAIGTALEAGGKTGSVGPVRMGNTGYTVNWAPWS